MWTLGCRGHGWPMTRLCLEAMAAKPGCDLHFVKTGKIVRQKAR